MSLFQETVLTLAGHHGLALDPASLQTNESGLDFQVAIAQTQDGQSWVLRIPRRQDVLTSTQREQTILILVQPYLPVQVPDWQIYTDELIAYPLLSGKPAGTIDPELQAYRWEIDAQNLPDAYLQSLGQALAALHSIEHQAIAEAGLKTPSITAIRTDWSERMARVKATYPVNPQLWNRWQRWLQNDALWPEHPALIHGDLHPGHILIDKQAQITGLIDWTEAQTADPASDFVAHYQIFGQASLDRLIQHYGQSGGRNWGNMAAQVIELSHAAGIELAEFAERSGLDEFKAMAQQHLAESPESSG